MSQAAVDRAAAIGALVSAAVVDQGGHLVHFQRMDRAEIAGPTLAVDKAFTAVAHRIATAELGRADRARRRRSAGLQANGGGRYVVFGGGLPCWSRRTCVVGGDRGQRRDGRAGRRRARGPALAVFESVLQRASPAD